MIKVIPKDSTINVTKLKTKPVSKILRIFFVSLHILFSLDFGFVTFKSTKYTLASKVMTCVLGIGLRVLCIFMYIHQLERMSFAWYIKYPIENSLHVLILSLTVKKRTFCFFLEYLESVDYQLGVSYSFGINSKIIISCVLAVSLKCIVTAVYCSEFVECHISEWLQYLYLSPFLSMDLPLIIVFFIFYATKFRLTALRNCMENNKFRAKDMQYVYRSLVDATETVKKAFDPIFIVALSINAPSLMMIIYRIIKDIKMNTKPPAGYVMEILTVIWIASTIFAPAIAASSLSAEVDKLKIILHNAILEDRDERQLRDIKRFIAYLEARPFKFRILRIIPMDASLPVILINLCITYIIVMLQITHLY